MFHIIKIKICIIRVWTFFPFKTFLIIIISFWEDVNIEEEEEFLQQEFNITKNEVDQKVNILLKGSFQVKSPAQNFLLFLIMKLYTKQQCSLMYILAPTFFEKDDKYVFKAKNSCCVKGIFSL